MPTSNGLTTKSSKRARGYAALRQPGHSITVTFPPSSLAPNPPKKKAPAFPPGLWSSEPLKVLAFGRSNLGGANGLTFGDAGAQRGQQRADDHHQHGPHLQFAGAHLLASLVANLLQNAWKYSSAADPARISLRADTEPGQATVYRVRDNGMGFTADEAAGLFQRHLRLPSARGLPGLGIGLATVQHIIDRHGGRIWAEGAPGQGACFSFTLGPAESAVSSIP